MTLKGAIMIMFLVYGGIKSIVIISPFNMIKKMLNEEMGFYIHAKNKKK